MSVLGIVFFFLFFMVEDENLVPYPFILFIPHFYNIYCHFSYCLYISSRTKGNLQAVYMTYSDCFFSAQVFAFFIENSCPFISLGVYTIITNWIPNNPCCKILSMVQKHYEFYQFHLLEVLSLETSLIWTGHSLGLLSGVTLGCSFLIILKMSSLPCLANHMFQELPE